MSRVLLLVLVVTGCEGTLMGGFIPEPVEHELPPEEVEPTPTSSIDPPKYVQARCEGRPLSRTYRGFGGETLEADRSDTALGLEGRRTSLYNSIDAARGNLDNMAGEWEFAKGFITEATGGAYGVRERNWYSEPSGSALLFATNFRAAFLACEKRITERRGFGMHADFTTLPTPQTARAQCSDLAIRFWKTRATEEQLADCVQYATVETAEETQPSKRWGYVCATLLSTTFVLTH